MTDPTQLPIDLPAPEDDGAAAHLPTLAMPAIALASTAGVTVRLDELGDGRTVLYIYPMTGRPGATLARENLGSNVPSRAQRSTAGHGP